jgi:hypothetical protein
MRCARMFFKAGNVMYLHVSYGNEYAILNVSRGNECAFLTCCSWSRMCCTSIFLTVVSVPYLHVAQGCKCRGSECDVMCCTSVFHIVLNVMYFHVSCTCTYMFLIVQNVLYFHVSQDSDCACFSW